MSQIDALEAEAAAQSHDEPAPDGPHPAGPWSAPSGVGGGGWGNWGPPPTWAPPPSGPKRSKRTRTLLAGLGATALVAASASVGLVVGRHQNPSTAASISPTSPNSSGSTGSAGSSGTSGAGSGSASANSPNASDIAAKVDPGLVDVYTQLAYQGEAAAGTGMVLTSTGEVLTNNHVVEGATSISVTDIGNGRTYKATVVGTDAADDVAVLKLTGASGLTTVTIGDSSAVSVGDAVVSIGNAGGVGGTPSVSIGNVTALNQSITASDGGSASSEQLTGLIETSATLQAGDSGGPLVDSSGRVVGMDTAASSTSGGFQIQSGSDQNYAIPVNSALAIAKQIEQGRASSTVHIGEAAFLGVEVESADNAGASDSGAVIANVVQGSPAEQAGLAQGDVIDSLGGTAIDSPQTLSSVMSSHHPGDKVQIGWTDTSGQQHYATLTLGTGPAA